MDILLFLTLLFVKHFIVDFPLQGPYQYTNKGTYLHMGGQLHAGLHGIGTFIVALFFVDFGVAMMIAVADAFIHYHIDWAKVNINKYFKWQSHTSEKFWWLLGFDQLLHTLTYIGFAYYIAP